MNYDVLYLSFPVECLPPHLPFSIFLQLLNMFPLLNILSVMTGFEILCSRDKICACACMYAVCVLTPPTGLALFSLTNPLPFPPIFPASHNPPLHNFPITFCFLFPSSLWASVFPANHSTPVSTTCFVHPTLLIPYHFQISSHPDACTNLHSYFFQPSSCIHRAVSGLFTEIY